MRIISSWARLGRFHVRDQSVVRAHFEPHPVAHARIPIAQDLVYAAGLHAGQTRKGGEEIPYIGHLPGVCSLTLEAGGDEDQAIAALLHDAAEDQGGRETLEEIRRRFGDRVARIVEACTDTFETPKPDWRRRKERYVEHLEAAASGRTKRIPSVTTALWPTPLPIRSSRAGSWPSSSERWPSWNGWHTRTTGDLHAETSGGSSAARQMIGDASLTTIRSGSGPATSPGRPRTPRHRSGPG
jgi:hypothetical protein